MSTFLRSQQISYIIKIKVLLTLVCVVTTYSDLTITNSPLPFLVGQTAVLTCTISSGVVDNIRWVSQEGVELASNAAVDELQLVLSPVNDSLSVHMAKFTCIVTRSYMNPTTFNQTLPVKVKVNTFTTTPSVMYNFIHRKKEHNYSIILTHLIEQ